MKKTETRIVGDLCVEPRSSDPYRVKSTDSYPYYI